MNPTCLLINLSDTPLDWMLSVILKKQKIASTRDPVTWSIATKYYNAQVDLHQLTVNNILSKDEQIRQVIDNCEAVIFYLGLATNLEDVEACWGEIHSAEPAVCLMVVDEAKEERRTRLLDWCLTNQFELVECDEDVEEEEDEEEAIKECTGKERVGEALEAHTWSNLTLVEEGEAGSEGEEEKKDSPEKAGGLEPNLDVEIDALLEGKNGEIGEDANFEDLFAQFASIRDRSANLNPDERKAYAERVAIAFWKSMGGSDDEIDGLDDLEDLSD